MHLKKSLVFYVKLNHFRSDFAKFGRIIDPK